MSSCRQEYQTDTVACAAVQEHTGEREPFRRPVSRDASCPGFPDGDLARTYAIVEALALQAGGQADISFLDARSALRRLFDKTYRQWLRSHLLLPSRGVLGRLAARLRSGKTCADFAPETFIPALLTFVEYPLRVLVAGRTIHDAEILCDRLHRHAPWHRFLSAPIDQPPKSAAFDMVLIASDVGMQDRLRLATIPTNLRIFCGSSPRLFAVPGSGGELAGKAVRSRRIDRKAA
jgi:hypothetical protein